MSETAAPERPQSAPAPPSPYAETTPAPSPAGPAPDDGSPVRLPPAIPWSRAVQTVRFSTRQLSFVFRAQREVGDPFRMRGMLRDEHVVVTSHPDHVKSLFTAKPEQAPSLTGESPLRPIVGPNSVLTADRPAPHAPAQAAAAAVPRRGGRAVHADDRRGRRPRDRRLAGRQAVRARAAHAGDHARRDHGRDLRHRGRRRPPARPSTACAGDPRACWPVDAARRADRRAASTSAATSRSGSIKRRARAARPRDRTR